MFEESICSLKNDQIWELWRPISRKRSKINFKNIMLISIPINKWSNSRNVEKNNFSTFRTPYFPNFVSLPFPGPFDSRRRNHLEGHLALLHVFLHWAKYFWAQTRPRSDNFHFCHDHHDDDHHDGHGHHHDHHHHDQNFFFFAISLEFIWFGENVEKKNLVMVMIMMVMVMAMVIIMMIIIMMVMTKMKIVRTGPCLGSNILSSMEENM